MHFKVTSSLLAIVVFLLATVLGGQLARADSLKVVKNGPVYADPSSHARVVGKVEKGMVVEIYAQTIGDPGGCWYWVALPNGNTGHVECSLGEEIAENDTSAAAPTAIAAQSAQKTFAIPEILPTLSGYQNIATIYRKPDTTVWARCDTSALANLVLLVKGMWWVKSATDKPGSMKYLKAGATINFEANGTAIEPGLVQLTPGTEVMLCVGEGAPAVGIPACSGLDWFAGVLDYDGSEYTILGTLRLAGWTFESDTASPLVFSLRNPGGFMYQSGKGRVTDKDGKVVVLGQEGQRVSEPKPTTKQSTLSDGEPSPPPDSKVGPAIEKAILAKFSPEKLCSGMVLASQKLIIADIKIGPYNEEGKYWRVDATPQCDMGSVVAIPRMVFSIDYYKLSLDANGKWKAELVMK